MHRLLARAASDEPGDGVERLLADEHARVAAARRERCEVRLDVHMRELDRELHEQVHARLEQRDRRAPHHALGVHDAPPQCG